MNFKTYKVKKTGLSIGENAFSKYKLNFNCIFGL